MTDKEKPEWTQCSKCKAYIPRHWKMHSKCGWGVDTQTTSPNIGSPFTTSDQVDFTQQDRNNRIERQVIVKAYGHKIWDLFKPTTPEEVGDLLLRTKRYIEN